MKRILGWIVAILVLFPFAMQTVNGDAIPPSPVIPRHSEKKVQHRDAYPAYAIAAGVVGVALTASLFGLRLIRKRNNDGPS